MSMGGVSDPSSFQGLPQDPVAQLKAIYRDPTLLFPPSAPGEEKELKKRIGETITVFLEANRETFDKASASDPEVRAAVELLNYQAFAHLGSEEKVNKITKETRALIENIRQRNLPPGTA